MLNPKIFHFLVVCYYIKINFFFQYNFNFMYLFRMYSIIFTDIEMPEMDGFETVSEIKKILAQNNIDK